MSAINLDTIPTRRDSVNKTILPFVQRRHAFLAILRERMLDKMRDQLHYLSFCLDLCLLAHDYMLHKR